MNEQKPVYVAMTDTVMSNWGMAKDKNNKLIVLCDNMAEAQTVESNMEHRTDMKKITISTTKPKFDPETNYIQEITKEIYPEWYEKDYFKDQKAEAKNENI